MELQVQKMTEISAEGKLEKIGSKCLDLLEKYVEKSDGSDGNSPMLVKSVGEALNELEPEARLYSKTRGNDKPETN